MLINLRHSYFNLMTGEMVVVVGVGLDEEVFDWYRIIEVRLVEEVRR